MELHYQFLASNGQRGKSNPLLELKNVRIQLASSWKMQYIRKRLYEIKNNRDTSALRKLICFSKVPFIAALIDRLCAVVQVGGRLFTSAHDSLQRNQWASDFQEENSDIEVLSGTYKTLGTSYTLTAAKDVFCVDPAWQSSEKAQACDRVHRHPQSEITYVYHLISEGTVDVDVLDVQTGRGTFSSGWDAGVLAGHAGPGGEDEDEDEDEDGGEEKDEDENDGGVEV